VRRRTTRRRSAFTLLLALFLVTIRATGQETGAPPGRPIEERLSALEEKVRRLEKQLKESRVEVTPDETVEARLERLETRVAELLSRIESQRPVPAQPATEPQAVQASLTTPSSAPSPPPPPVGETMGTMPYAGYMELHLNQARGQASQLDFHRFILLFGHTFSPRIKFWSEVEIEHAFIEPGEEGGEIAVEQAYLDFFMRPELNFRAGILLAPVGIINERHEPPAFHGVERPFVDTVIIPTTWFDAGFGIHGDLGRGFSYKLYGMAPPDASGFSAEEGIRGGRQSGFLSVVNDLGVTGRVEYRGVRRLTLGSSLFAANTGFRFQNPNPRLGLKLNPRLSLFEFDGRYRWRRFELRGEFAQLWISQTKELNLALEQQLGFNPNIARSQLGYYGEAAYHVLPFHKTLDIVPFFRFERFNTQHRMAEGFLPLPQFDRTAYTLGFSVRPNPDVALKLDYQFMRNRSDVIPIPNRFNVGIGWWF